VDAPELRVDRLEQTLHLRAVRQVRRVGPVPLAAPREGIGDVPGGLLADVDQGEDRATLGCQGCEGGADAAAAAGDDDEPVREVDGTVGPRAHQCFPRGIVQPMRLPTLKMYLVIATPST